MITPATTITELKKLLESGEVSQSEVIGYYQERLKKYNTQINCAVELFEQADLRDTNGPLAGIPGLIKDNICQQGHIAAAGSRMLEKYKAPYNATIAQKLFNAGAVSLGRANMDEFAMGASGEYSAFGLTRNPWNLEHSPGGSSSGPAASVAAGLAPWAIGTETGGSVRQPASFCNLVGLYPTYGLFSRYGVIAFASSTDQVGPLTKTVADNALLTSIMSGKDIHDATTIQQEQQDYTRFLTGKLPENCVIGILDDALTSEGIDPEVRENFEQNIKILEKLGATIKRISIPSLKYGIAVYFILSRAEAASNLCRFDGSLYGSSNRGQDGLFNMYMNTRHDFFGEEVQRRLLLGNYVLSAGHFDSYYQKAQKVRALIRKEIETACKDITAIISPTTSALPFKLGEEISDPLQMYMADYFTVPNCVAGLPALSVPGGFSKDGLPIGIQFMGGALSEGTLYQCAHAFEQATQHHLRTPQGFE